MKTKRIVQQHVLFPVKVQRLQLGLSQGAKNPTMKTFDPKPQLADR